MRSEMIGEERDVGTWCVSCWQIYIFWMEAMVSF
jgi:hypothetical protein